MLLSVWPLPISLATTFGISFDFSSSPYLDVSVQAVPLRNLWIQLRMTGLPPAGLLHSDIHASMPTYGSTWLFAVSRVLLRLPVPRHSPCALCSLTLFCDNQVLPTNCIFCYPKNLNSLLASLFLFTIVQFSRYNFQRVSSLWWAQVDSNHRPHAYQACALTC